MAEHMQAAIAGNLCVETTLHITDEGIHAADRKRHIEIDHGRETSP